MATVFAIAAAVCAVGWLKTMIGLRAIILYMEGKKYAPPTPEELKACCTVAVRRTFGLKA